MPRTAHPRVVAAFGPLVEHLAYERRVERQEDKVVPLDALLGEGGAELGAAARAAGATRVPVQLLDLHGLRARDARAALETCTEPVCVVWFGKGTGALREVFLEFLGRRPELLVVDFAGETATRPQESMGVVLREELHDQLLDALERPARRRVARPEAPVPARPEARRDTRAAKRPPARPSLWARLWAWLRSLFAGR